MLRKIIVIFIIGMSTSACTEEQKRAISEALMVGTLYAIDKDLGNGAAKRITCKRSNTCGNYAWDSFIGSSGSIVWVCRDKSNGQFALKEKCAGLIQHDLTWPDN